MAKECPGQPTRKGLQNLTRIRKGLLPGSSQAAAEVNKGSIRLRRRKGDKPVKPDPPPKEADARKAGKARAAEAAIDRDVARLRLKGLEILRRGGFDGSPSELPAPELPSASSSSVAAPLPASVQS